MCIHVHSVTVLSVANTTFCHLECSLLKTLLFPLLIIEWFICEKSFCSLARLSKWWQWVFAGWWEVCCGPVESSVLHFQLRPSSADLFFGLQVGVGSGEMEFSRTDFPFPCSFGLLLSRCCTYDWHAWHSLLISSWILCVVMDLGKGNMLVNLSFCFQCGWSTA